MCTWQSVMISALVEHKRVLVSNPEVRRLGELVVHLDMLGVHHRCVRHGMHEVILTHHLNFVLWAPLLLVEKVVMQYVRRSLPIRSSRWSAPVTLGRGGLCKKRVNLSNNRNNKGYLLDPDQNRQSQIIRFSIQYVIFRASIFVIKTFDMPFLAFRQTPRTLWQDYDSKITCNRVYVASQIWKYIVVSPLLQRKMVRKRIKVFSETGSKHEEIHQLRVISIK